MNQNLKSGFIPKVAWSRQLLQLAMPIVVLVCLTPAELQAQNDYQFNVDTAGSSGNQRASWRTPDVQTPRMTSQFAPQTDPISSWPDQRVSFESQVSPANFDSSGSTEGPNTSSDSRNAAISWTKDFVIAKVSAFLSKMTRNQKGPGSLNVSKMLGSLAIVLGAYFAFVWVVRKISPAANTHLPPTVVQVLGRTPFGPKQYLQLVKLGSKLVLLIHGPDGTHPLGEITDPVEVEQLLCQCKSRVGGKRFASEQQRPQPARTRANSAPAETLSPGLVNILRSIESAAKQHGGSVFEA